MSKITQEWRCSKCRQITIHKAQPYYDHSGVAKFSETSGIRVLERWKKCTSCGEESRTLEMTGDDYSDLLDAKRRLTELKSKLEELDNAIALIKKVIR